jgi:acyl-CoA thioesterase FadM
MAFEHTIRVGWGDCDPARIAYTARLPAFALEAIDAWWEHHLGGGWYQMELDHGFGTPFVSMQIDFVGPVTPRHRLVCAVSPTRLGTTSIGFRVIGRQDGREVARLLYVHSPHVAKVDYGRYESELLAHFDSFAGKPLGEIETAVIVTGVMNILRRHRVRIDPSFTTVHVALLVAEGLGKQLDPSLDIVARAVPIIAAALLRTPTGIAEKRAVPGR